MPYDSDIVVTCCRIRGPLARPLAIGGRAMVLDGSRILHGEIEGAKDAALMLTI